MQRVKKLFKSGQSSEKQTSDSPLMSHPQGNVEAVARAEQRLSKDSEPSYLNKTSKVGLFTMNVSTFVVAGPIDPAKITFLRKLKHSADAQSWKVSYYGQDYFLKVFERPNVDRRSPDGVPLERFLCVKESFECLDQAGMESSTWKPKYFGSILEMNPDLCCPHLDDFRKSKRFPRGVMLEFIPNLEPITPKNYTPARAQLLLEGAKGIHSAGIIHWDLQPRNICVQKDTDRAVILAFDCAEVYPKFTLIDGRLQPQFDAEMRSFVGYLEALKKDSIVGMVDESFPWYFYGEKPADLKQFWETTDLWGNEIL